MLAGPASPGLLFFSNMDFHRPHVSQKNSNDNATDLQEVASFLFAARSDAQSINVQSGALALSEEWALKTNGSHRHRSIPVEDDVDVIPAVGLAFMHHAIAALSMPLFSMALTLG